MVSIQRWLLAVDGAVASCSAAAGVAVGGERPYLRQGLGGGAVLRLVTGISSAGAIRALKFNGVRTPEEGSR